MRGDLRIPAPSRESYINYLNHKYGGIFFYYRCDLTGKSVALSLEEGVIVIHVSVRKLR
jgi:hypothetical protein